MLRQTVGFTDIGKALDGSEREIAGFVTAAMRDAGAGLKETLRDQVRTAGLGSRLANTWRGNTYPEAGASLDPAAYIWSNAPNIVASFATGATILPLNGRKYLWIPTKNVPATRQRRSSSHAAGPAEVQEVFKQPLIMIPGRSGHMLAFIDASLTSNRRVRSAARARGAVKGKPRLVLMFTAVPTLRVAKKLDLDGAGQFWGDQFPALLQDRWR
ncbi:MAG: DUF6441 family protein [Janthinobacterium lividum]